MPMNLLGSGEQSYTSRAERGAEGFLTKIRVFQIVLLIVPSCHPQPYQVQLED